MQFLIHLYYYTHFYISYIYSLIFRIFFILLFCYYLQFSNWFYIINQFSLSFISFMIISIIIILINFPYRILSHTAKTFPALSHIPSSPIINVSLPCNWIWSMSRAKTIRKPLRLFALCTLLVRIIVCDSPCNIRPLLDATSSKLTKYYIYCLHSDALNTSIERKEEFYMHIQIYLSYLFILIDTIFSFQRDIACDWFVAARW